jgi:hypothetical protein
MLRIKILNHITKEGSKYILWSHKGKRLGTFPTRAAAVKREREVEYFKHKKGGK